MDELLAHNVKQTFISEVIVLLPCALLHLSLTPFKRSRYVYTLCSIGGDSRASLGNPGLLS